MQSKSAILLLLPLIVGLVEKCSALKCQDCSYSDLADVADVSANFYCEKGSPDAEKNTKVVECFEGAEGCMTVHVLSPRGRSAFSSCIRRSDLETCSKKITADSDIFEATKKNECTWKWNIDSTGISTLKTQCMNKQEKNNGTLGNNVGGSAFICACFGDMCNEQKEVKHYGF